VWRVAPMGLLIMETVIGSVVSVWQGLIDFTMIVWGELSIFAQPLLPFMIFALLVCLAYRFEGE